MLAVIGLVTVCIVVIVFLYLATETSNCDTVKSFSFLGFGVAKLGNDVKFNNNVKRLCGTERKVIVLVPVFLIKYFKSAWATNMFSL